MAVRSGVTDVRSENPSDRLSSDNDDCLPVRIQGCTDKGRLMHIRIRRRCVKTKVSEVLLLLEGGGSQMVLLDFDTPFLYGAIQANLTVYPIEVSMEVQVELRYRFNAFTNDVERNIFVGRVNGVAFQSEAHQDGFDA